MGWREKMGGAVAITKTETMEQKEQKEQKGPDREASATSATKVEKVKNYPIPTTEKEFAMDERQAIIEADGGQDSGLVEYPVAIVMKSTILGADVPVEFWPDRAEVDGVQYSNDELAELLSRGPPVADLRAVHETKKSFDGEVVPGVVGEKILSRTIPLDK